MPASADELTQALSSLLEAQEGIHARLHHLDIAPKSAPDMAFRFFYPAFRDGEPTVTDLVSFLKHRIVSYCLPRHERQRAREMMNQAGGFDFQQASLLVAKAEKLFMDASAHLKRSGEAGELMLYALIEKYLEAPLIVTKMLLKTNAQMPVHGTDGIHAKYDSTSKNLIFYFGESKIHATFASGLGSAIKSMTAFLNDADVREHELQLITNHADLSTLPHEQQQAFLDYLNPYKDASNLRVERIACLLGFSDSIYQQITALDRELRQPKFVEEFAALAPQLLSDLLKGIQSNKIDPKRVDFFLIPMPCVDDFRRKFEEALGHV